jgi:ribosome recycling factor
MAYSFDAFTKAVAETTDWLQREYGGIRTGRATPMILDSVTVESYGSMMSIKEVGSVGVEDARTLRVTPWDPSQVKAIEKGITAANLGLSVVTDERGLRIVFPELTADRRDQLTKLAKSKLEDARVAIRKARDEANKTLEAEEKSGGVSEDEKFRLKAELQKKVDAANTALEEMFAKKEAEMHS